MANQAAAARKPKTSFRKNDQGPGWTVVSDAPLNPGDKVTIIRKDGSASEVMIVGLLHRNRYNDYVYSFDQVWTKAKPSVADIL